jgi:glycosyltransferase involved in cell wall biosynthesis
MTQARWHLAVLVPARDEEYLLPRCLHSIQRAVLRLASNTTSDVIVVSDCSIDRTCEMARAILPAESAVISVSLGTVGGARAIAARAALSRYQGPLDRCWLVNTDADCEVPEDWLLSHLAIAEKGFAAVAGVIDVDSFLEHNAEVASRFRFTYLIREDGTHPHVHGANLGIRADAYVLAGGWSALATGEDHELWNRLAACDIKRLSDSKLSVVTSGRRHGRAPQGFADALAAHNGSMA